VSLKAGGLRDALELPCEFSLWLRRTNFWRGITSPRTDGSESATKKRMVYP